MESVVLANMRIRSQMFLLIGAVFLFFGIAVAAAISSIERTAESFSGFVDNDQAELLALSEMYAQGLQMGQALRNVQLDPGNKSAYENLSRASSAFALAIGKANKLAAGEREKMAVLTKIVELRERQRSVQEKIVAFSQANDLAAAKVLTNEQETPLWRELKLLVTDSIKATEVSASQAKIRVIDSAKSAIRTAVMLAVAAVVLGLLFSWGIVRGITRALAQAVNGASQIAAGNIGSSIEARGSNELGQLMAAMETMRVNLRAMIARMALGSERLAASSQQLVAASTQVVAASQQQSDAASNVAATVQEISVSSEQMASRTQEAHGLACASRSLAASGQAIIGQAVVSINEIAETVRAAALGIVELESQSARISSVAAVIREVAEQTNLLALNAAIEAARAGDQGRGFAVVADEVRKLAERTALSTQEITRTIEGMRKSASESARMIRGTVEKVAAGVDRAQQASVAIKEIGDESGATQGMVSEISTAIGDQSSATRSIAVEIEKIARMSEQSTATANESAGAARGLDLLAQEFHLMVASYRI